MTSKNGVLDRVVVYMKLNDKQKQSLCDWLLQNKINHELFTFEIGMMKHDE